MNNQWNGPKIELHPIHYENVKMLCYDSLANLPKEKQNRESFYNICLSIYNQLKNAGF